MARERRKSTPRFLLRYFAVIGLVLGLAGLVVPFAATGLTAGDKQTLMSLGGALTGGGLVLLIASVLVPGRRP
ncbi:hypothetical protein [Celeribacter indicus]|uniref:Uncharacterized protein n=1 Tax=Celeribacter indicus TaxID=1208324 RepID=A0A0B5E2R2_9RHOB|nr:hypothetical protein [Celeribacter indicus]AJE46732.1 hypothetical protein P73_2017 [Celeribacter indicus]SDX05068.1 hypothetical protein SAMN05443573_11238 [Celeribacter indicus]